MDLFPRSDIFMFFAQWVSHPYGLKTLIDKGFQFSHSFTLDINIIVSTWPEFGQLMSDDRFEIFRLWKHVNCFFNVFEVRENISMVLRFTGTYHYTASSFVLISPHSKPFVVFPEKQV